jgi:transposase
MIMSWRRGQAYGQDLRDRVLQTPGRLCEVAARFGVSASYVCRARARSQQLGQSSPGPQRNHVPLRLGALKDEVMAQVARAPEQTLAQLCQWLQGVHGIVVKPSTMHKSLKRFGLSYKKKRSTPASSTART